VVSNFIDVFFETVGSKLVCLIYIKKYDGSGDAVFVESYSTLGNKPKNEILFVRMGNSSRELALPRDIFEYGVTVGGAKDKRGGSKVTPVKPTNVVPIKPTQADGGWVGPFTLLDCALTNKIVTLLVAEQPKLVKCKFDQADFQPWYDAFHLVGSKVFLKAYKGYNVSDGWFYQIKSAEVDPVVAIQEKYLNQMSDPNYIEYAGLAFKVFKEEICEPKSLRYNWDAVFVKFITERGDFYSLKCDLEGNYDEVPIGSANYISGFPDIFEDLQIIGPVSRWRVKDVSEIGP
jgi:hypothetical protein